MKDERAKERKRIDRRFTEHWLRFLELTGAKDDTPSVFLELHYAYGGPDRHYHAKKHVVEGLDLLEEFRADVPWIFQDDFADSEFQIATELAFWDHDIRYIPGAKDNEEKSAEISQNHARRLGWSESVGRLSNVFIRATEHRGSGAPYGSGSKIVCDLDLSSLASPWEEFCENTRNIHQEFSQYDTPTFMAGQRAYLAKLRDSRVDKNIYWTDWFRDRFEARAQENLDRFIGGEFHEK